MCVYVCVRACVDACAHVRVRARRSRAPHCATQCGAREVEGRAPPASDRAYTPRPGRPVGLGGGGGGAGAADYTSRAAACGSCPSLPEPAEGRASAQRASRPGITPRPPGLKRARPLALLFRRKLATTHRNAPGPVATRGFCARAGEARRAAQACAGVVATAGGGAKAGRVGRGSVPRCAAPEGVRRRAEPCLGALERTCVRVRGPEETCVQYTNDYFFFHTASTKLAAF